ncbi:MAG: tRNA (adenosine(37)-N6)-threonylcarbamoyltransferase complex ATPase subunit type 1 TsaE [Bacteroidota bacterium]
MFSVEINSIKAIEKTAKELIDRFPQQRVFAFYGKMGAGKTTFIQAMCRQLGTADNVTSPSFAIINEYKTDAGDSIYHFDFYRIKEIGEAYDLGYEDYFYSGSYCLIEWPEKIDPLLPENYVSVNITVEEKEVRKITASPGLH